MGVVDGAQTVAEVGVRFGRTTSQFGDTRRRFDGISIDGPGTYDGPALTNDAVEQTCQRNEWVRFGRIGSRLVPDYLVPEGPVTKW